MNELDLLRAADPSTAPSTQALAAARAQVMGEALRADPQGVAHGAAAAVAPPVLRRRRTSRWAVATASVAAAAVALLVIPVLDSGPARPSATAEASAFLLRSADAVTVGTGGEPDAREAAYWYVRSNVEGDRIEDGTREVWLGHRAPGRLVQPQFPNQALEDPASFFGLSWDELFDLPTETVALRARVYALAGDSGPGPDAEAFVVVGDLLRESPAPPALRAALLRVAATIPGVQVAPPTTDSEGRAVIPVVHRGPAIEARLLMHPDDGRLLGEDEVAVRDLPGAEGRPAIAAGTVISRSSVLAAGPVVNSSTTLP